MNCELRNKLERVGMLMESGDELERDLALELLREVYAEIKFGSATEKHGGEFVREISVQEPEPVDEAALEGEDCRVTEERVEEPVDEPVREPKPVVWEPAVEEEPHVVPRMVAPEVIRSLYGTEADDDTEDEEAMRQEPETNNEYVAEIAAEHTQEQEPKSRTTLGDVMATGHKTLGETLRGGSERDMASKIAATERPGLKRSIGLNDRFLMIRDMFDGDADAFDSAIARLDAFTDLDEAVIWIRDNFDWSADNKGAALLVGLLERKLGH